MVKEESPIRKIFYVEKVQFLRSMLEVALRAKGAEIYTINTMENNFYLLDDLNPDLVIFDIQTVGDSLEALLSYRGKAVLVATGSKEDEQLVLGRVNHFMAKPIEARNLGQRILSYLE